MLRLDGNDSAVSDQITRRTAYNAPMYVWLRCDLLQSAYSDSTRRNDD